MAMADLAAIQAAVQAAIRDDQRQELVEQARRRRAEQRRQQEEGAARAKQHGALERHKWLLQLQCLALMQTLTPLRRLAMQQLELRAALEEQRGRHRQLQLLRKELLHSRRLAAQREDERSSRTTEVAEAAAAAGRRARQEARRQTEAEQAEGDCETGLGGVGVRL